MLASRPSLFWALASISTLLSAATQAPRNAPWALDSTLRSGDDTIARVGRAFQRALDASDSLTHPLHVLPSEGLNRTSSEIRNSADDKLLSKGAGKDWSLPRLEATAEEANLSNSSSSRQAALSARLRPEEDSRPELKASHPVVNQSSSAPPHFRAENNGDPQSQTVPSSGGDLKSLASLNKPSASEEVWTHAAQQVVDMLAGRTQASHGHERAVDETSRRAVIAPDLQSDRVIDNREMRTETRNQKLDSPAVRTRFMAPKELPVALPGVAHERVLSTKVQDSGSWPHWPSWNRKLSEDKKNTAPTEDEVADLMKWSHKDVSDGSHRATGVSERHWSSDDESDGSHRATGMSEREWSSKEDSDRNDTPMDTIDAMIRKNSVKKDSDGSHRATGASETKWSSNDESDRSHRATRLSGKKKSSKDDSDGSDRATDAIDAMIRDRSDKEGSDRRTLATDTSNRQWSSRDDSDRSGRATDALDRDGYHRNGGLDSLTKALGKEGFDATPMGGSVQKMQELLRETMMPKVEKAHLANQLQLKTLAAAVARCGKTKNRHLSGANGAKNKYLNLSPLHKTCRAGEAGARTEKNNCYNALADKGKIKKLKCAAFAMSKKVLTNQHANKQVMQKGASETDGNYVNRITRTVCGSGMPGTCTGFKCNFEKARSACAEAQNEHSKQQQLCKKLDRHYVAKNSECDSLQDEMDGAACKRAIDIKDACETYAECYTAKKQAFLIARKAIATEEKDRKAEWRGLKRMECLVNSFSDGAVSKSEVARCKAKSYDTQHLNMKYPKLSRMAACSIPNLYPTTPAYKKAEFSPLPALAKGKRGAECTGIESVSTTPKSGSPKKCKCRRVTMNGPYYGGPIVKCTNCLDVRRSRDRSSCPDGTKIFSPRSKNDWKTILASAGPLRNPHWIVDVTRPQDGCAGCRPGEKQGSLNFRKSWRTSDGSPWWLTNARYTESQGEYMANCYLNLLPSKHSGEVSWSDGKCNYHSKSYYCQPRHMSLKPKSGSPDACKCDKVELTGSYSAGALVRCMNCLDVSKSIDKNSCPVGTKLFAPASRGDWRTFIDSTKALRAPHFIVDITRPKDGCPGCTRSKMNSESPGQALWRTSDGAPWWLRSTRYTEPRGDYKANCYMDLWKKTSVIGEDSITFSDSNCDYHSKSYYCQPLQGGVDQ